MRDRNASQDSDSAAPAPSFAMPPAYPQAHLIGPIRRAPFELQVKPSIDQLSAQRKRLAYIEFRLWFFGEVTRKIVLKRFTKT